MPETTDGWYRIGALDFFHQESSGIIGPFSVPKLFRLAEHYNWGLTQPLQSLALISEMHQKYELMIWQKFVLQLIMQIEFGNR